MAKSPTNSGTSSNDWVGELVEDYGDTDLEDLQEAVASGEFEWGHKRKYVYPSEEVAWMEWFYVDNLGDKFQGCCRKCTKVYVRLSRAATIDAIRIHCQRNCAPDQDRQSYSLPDKAPF